MDVEPPRTFQHSRCTMAYLTFDRRGNEPPARLGHSAERFLAELTDAAYRVALKHKIQGSFLDVELDLWSALREIVEKEAQLRRPLSRASVVA